MEANQACFTVGIPRSIDMAHMFLVGIIISLVSVKLSICGIVKSKICGIVKFGKSNNMVEIVGVFFAINNLIILPFISARNSGSSV